MKSVRALLNRLIDYAGLFPPAGLGMAAAVGAYLEQARGPHAWALGRFILPVSRLGEFEDCLRQARPADPERPVELSVLAGADVEQDARTIEEFNRLFAGEAAICAVETKAASVYQVEASTASLPEGVEAYVEVQDARESLSGGDSLAAMLDAIPHPRARAKVRTGGITPEAFPSPAALVRFIELCNQRNLAFKATAGLHHPIRSVHPLTHEAGSGCVTMHGFLNVFLASAWIRNGIGHEDALAILEEANPRAFLFDDGGVGWQAQRLTSEQIAATRRDFAISFGSCSFTEPIADLQSLGLVNHRNQGGE